MSRRFLSLVFVLALLVSAVCASGAVAARFYTPDYGSKTPEEIGGFDLGANGALTPIPGSPFPAEEPGLGGLWNLAFTPDGTRAISGFYFTGGVQAYRVPPNGIFELAGATPTASATSVAITPGGRYAFVSTREFMSKPAEGIHRFAVGADGTLTSLGLPAPLGDSSEDIAVSPDGRFLFAQQGNAVARFAVGGDGSLAPLGTTPAPGAYLLSTSGDERFLYVFSEGGGEPGVSTFAIGAEGGLSQIGPTASIGPASAKRFTVSPDGRFAFIPDYNNDSIRTISIAPDGTPSVRGGGMPVVNPESVGVSPDGRHLVFYRAGGSENALGVATIGADGSLTQLPFETPWSTGEPERIVFQPQPTPVARFASQPGAPGQATQFDANASNGAARYDWDFGDGTKLTDGGSNPSHVYASPGVYTVTLATADRNGCSTRHIYNGQSTVCPGGSTPIATATVDTLPLLGKPKAVPKKFAPKVKGAKGGKVRRGTTFRYTVSEAATVRFKIERKRSGRLVGGKCKPRTPKNQKRNKCVSFKRVGSRSQAAKAGANKLKWNGKLKGKPLVPGSYRATVVATDRAGGRSTPKTVGFRILLLPRES